MSLWSRRALSSSFPCWGEAVPPPCCPPSPLAALGAEGMFWKRLAELIPIPGSAERIFFGEGSGWDALPSPVRNAQRNRRCLVPALPAAPPATPGPRSLPRFKCSLKQKTQKPQTKCLRFAPRQRLVLPVLWEGEEGRTGLFLLRKGP